MNSLTIHHCWIQGEAALPAPFAANIAAWKANFPEAKFVLWDLQSACDRWSDFRLLQERCFHHATRADMILARALRDYGGIATGTDVSVNVPGPLKDWIAINDSLVLVNPSRHESSNGLSYFRAANHPFIAEVCRAQIAAPDRLSSSNIPLVTGPQCWYRVLASRAWNLSLATDSRAYTRLWHDRTFYNANGWVDPGYAASWQKA